MQNERLSLEDFQLLQVTDNDELTQLLGGEAAPVAAGCHITAPAGTACYEDCD